MAIGSFSSVNTAFYSANVATDANYQPAGPFAIPPQFVGGPLATVVLGTNGSGYTSQPLVTVTDSLAEGVGAVVVAQMQLNGAQTVTGPGAGFNGADTVQLQPQSPADTTAVYTVATTKLVTSPPVNAPGTSYAPTNTITLAGGTSSVAGILTIATTQISTTAGITVATAGTNYVVGDKITVTGGAVFQVATLTGSGVATITLVSGGSYAANNTGAGGLVQTSTTGIGTGATFTAALANFGVLTTTVSTPGNYTVDGTALTQSATSGTGTGATFTGTVANYGILTVTILTPGVLNIVGTSPVPQGTSSGPGTGATFTPTYNVVGLSLVNPGNGYTAATLAFSGGGGAAPTGSTATVTADTVEQNMLLMIELMRSFVASLTTYNQVRIFHNILEKVMIKLKTGGARSQAFSGSAMATTLQAAALNRYAKDQTHPSFL